MNYIYPAKDKDDHIRLKTENLLMNFLEHSHLHINAHKHTWTPQTKKTDNKIMEKKRVYAYSDCSSNTDIRPKHR